MSIPPLARQAPHDSRARSGALWVSASTVATGVANYAFALVLIRVLAPADYSSYAAVQSLLLILGSGCMAAVPWALAHHVAADTTRHAARQALGFGLAAAGVQGLGFAGAAFLIVVPTAGVGLAATTAAAAFSLSVITAPLGILQGRQQLRRIAALRVVEALVRLTVAGVLLAVVGPEPWLVVLGFTVGSLTLFVAATAAIRSALPPVWTFTAASRTLLARSARLGLVQLALASTGVVDTIAVTFTSLTTADTAAYQVAALLGRVPLYLGTAVALAYFPAMSGLAHDDQTGPVLAAATRLTTLVGLPVAVLVATCPPLLLDVLTGGQADRVRSVLPATAVCGFAVAAATVVLTGLQARGRYRAALVTIGPISLAQPLVLVAVGRSGSLPGFALAAAALAVTALVVTSTRSRHWRPWSGLSRGDVAWLCVTTATAAIAYLSPWAWVLAAASGLLVLRRALAPPV